MLQLWPLILLGLAVWGTKTDARAVNVSNTWTMPQEGLNVFYRFFRDRISWFEADAVCQFHHANLVTVDNSFQFDATRDLLRELDVNDIVWIGLMRPQSSDRFMWSNSRPLVTDTGYWAESLPLMDAPLCAVIDPIRDYRWHALRCGGPETASFLCEMPVPAWADACILKDMPNLTMQYMADTASIELIRNCAEEGLLKQSCKGKQDRDRALRELICPRERLEAQRINDITNSHFKSLQIINSIRTDNNENNDIELLPLGETSSYVGSSSNSEISEQLPTEKNNVQRLIEQFNVDELMQADEPSLAMSGYHIPDEIPKPVKKAAKKVLVSNVGEYQKKNRAVKYDERIELPPPTPKPKKQQQLLALEDMMMGDQPQQSGEPEMLEHVGPEEDEVSNEIMEPLPHMKKVLPQDLKTMAPITEKSSDEAKERRAEGKQAHGVNEESERKHFPQTTSNAALTTTSTAAAPTTTATATTTITTTATSTPATTTTPTTTAALSSSNVPILTTSDITSSAKVPANTREAHLNTHPSAATVQAPSITTTPQSSSATTAHSAGSVIHIHSSSHPSSTLTPHAAPKSNEFDDTASITETPLTIGHPMHPQQQQPHGIMSEELQHPHLKESVDNSHFIPPMLLVKSHYVPPLKHSEHFGNEHHGHDMAHIEHGDLQLTTGKPSDNPVYSMTPNFAPTTTTRVHTANTKDDETNVEAMTTTLVTTTMTAIKSREATTIDEELTKKATFERTSGLEQQQNHHKKQPTQLNAKLIDSSTSMTGNQQQHQQQQQNIQPANMKAQTPATNERTEKIENAEGIVATTDEQSATKAAITTSASVANKQHSTTETATKRTTTTTIRAPTTTMKTADVDHMTHDDIEKPVKHTKPQTKAAVELTKEEIPIKTSKSLAEEDEALITTTTTKTGELKEVRAADTKRSRQEEETKIREEQAATTTTETHTTTTKPTERIDTVTSAPSTTSDGLTTTKTAATATATTEVTATTATHAATTTTTTNLCDTDIVESTTTDATEQSSAIDIANGKILTRVHRICQPNYEKHNGKHSKHHDNVAAPPTPTTHNFLNAETETPLYKPNRRRVLTKPETVSYFKKIIG